MPKVGSARVQPQTGVITFSQTESASAPLTSFTLQTPTAGLNLFESYLNNSGNVTLELRSIAAGPSINLIPNRGVIYISVDPGSFAPLDGNGRVPWDNLPGEVQTLPIAFVIPGRPANGQVYNVVLPIPCTIAADFSGSGVYAGSIATGNAEFLLRRISNGESTTIGTATFTSASHTSCQWSSQATTMVAGDVLQLVAPTPQDATLADIGISVLATKS
jgi:hypothetical protein